MLRPGAMIQFMEEDCKDIFFLGLPVQKPRQLIMMQGFESWDNGRASVSLRSPATGEYCFRTFHEVIQTVLSGRVSSNQEISFLVRTYTMPTSESLTTVSTTPDEDLGDIARHVKLQLPVKTKANKKQLPFGLAPPKKNRRRAAKRQSGPEQQKKPRQEVDGCGRRMPFSLGLGAQVVAASLAHQRLDDSSDSSAGPSSSSCNESRSDVCLVEESSGAETDSSLKAAGAVVLNEEREIRNVEVAMPSVPAESPNQPAPTPDPKSFCNANLGVVDLGWQQSKRLATCRQCCDKISVGDGRVAWAYNVKKFHAWLHTGCLLPHLRQEHEDMQPAVRQAIAFLTDWLAQHAEGSKPPVFVDLLNQLQQSVPL